MSAENILFLLDECDEFNVLLKESVGPVAILALMLLAACAAVGVYTQSITLGLCALIVGGWVGLIGAWVVDRVRAGHPG